MKKGTYLPPWFLQITGVLIIIGGGFFWGLTGHESPLIIGAGISLAGLGAYSGIHISVEKELGAGEDDKRKAK
jgi:hypothetical protein